MYIKMFTYRGITVRIWAKSFRINDMADLIRQPVEPDERQIRRLIDACQVEKFPNDEHRQIYHAWRHYPLAMKLSAFLFFMLGFAVATGIALALRP